MTLTDNSTSILIDRLDGDDVAVIYPTAAAASDALENSQLIADLCSEDCVECWIPVDGLPVDLSVRNVIVAG